MPDYHEVKSALIKLEVVYEHSHLVKDFKTVQELASFLKDHPKVAAAVGYVPKEKK
jgi:hypothetical protein